MLRNDISIQISQYQVQLWQLVEHSVMTSLVLPGAFHWVTLVVNTAWCVFMRSDHTHPCVFKLIIASSKSLVQWAAEMSQVQRHLLPTQPSSGNPSGWSSCFTQVAHYRSFYLLHWELYEDLICLQTKLKFKSQQVIRPSTAPHSSHHH